MYLKNLTLLNFKNYKQLELEFSPRINCLTGDNGSGKTNLLDAIYYLSFCKSMFNPVDSQNINYNENFFAVQGNYVVDEIKENIYCCVKRGQKKQFRRNKKEYERLSEHIGLIPLVAITPLDNVLFTGGSEERRKFIDSVISQFDRLYLEDLIRYNKALAQRNQLLKDLYRHPAGSVEETLELWNEQLILHGTRIYEKRKIFTQEFIPVFQYYYSFISEGKELVSLLYESQLHRQNFRDLLHESVGKDKILQYTTTGIHKDDLFLELEKHPIKKIGSQGQQKTYLIALKMAQFDFIKKNKKFNPVLLLDDIFDKLDVFRVKQILNLVADNISGQIFITDTSHERLEKILNTNNIQYNLFRIKDNLIQKL
ncbi:MAG: DNA replication and repair protein RecF [Bacteroidia bacterium]|nr:DNA replication and repair protein RecF [Bacteroidia bacterium]